jgi:hypothetical protein
MGQKGPNEMGLGTGCKRGTEVMTGCQLVVCLDAGFDRGKRVEGCQQQMCLGTGSKHE